MPQVIHSLKGKQPQRTRRHDKNYPKNTKSEAKECHRKNAKYNVIIEDFVLDYNHPEDITEKSTKTIQKRKLPNDDDWDWAPYPRRIKTQRHDVSLYENNGYMSDEFESSHIVPDWVGDEEQGSVCLSSSDGDNDDSLNAKAADIRLVTIDEVIYFDAFKLPGCHNYDAEPICFDIEKLCEIVGVEGVNDNNLLVDKQKNGHLEMLVTFTNSRLALCEDDQKTLKEVNQSVPYSSPFDCSEDEDNSDQLQNDCQVEEFKFARCFKCRRKVYIMQDCPRHLTKGKMASKRVT